MHAHTEAVSGGAQGSKNIACIEVCVIRLACKACLPDLIYGDHSVSDVVEGNLPISIHIQNVKRLLGFLRLQEMLQVLRQYVRSARQRSVMQNDCEQLRRLVV
jgi:hypothetical protein